MEDIIMKTKEGIKLTLMDKLNFLRAKRKGLKHETLEKLLEVAAKNGENSIECIIVDNEMIYISFSKDNVIYRIEKNIETVQYINCTDEKEEVYIRKGRENSIQLHFSNFDVKATSIRKTDENIIDDLNQYIKLINDKLKYQDLKNISMYMCELLHPIVLEVTEELHDLRWIVESVTYTKDMQLASIIYREYYDDIQEYKEIFYDNEELIIRYHEYGADESHSKVQVDASFLYFEVTNTQNTAPWYKELKHISRNFIMEFDKEDNYIKGIIKRTRLNKKIKDLIFKEEEEALRRFNERKISQ